MASAVKEKQEPAPEAAEKDDTATSEENTKDYEKDGPK